MNPLLIYMIKAAIYLSGFYIVFRLFLSKDTMYGRNRAFIMISVISALILPCITLEAGKSLNMQKFGRILSEIFISGPSEDGSKMISSASDLSVYTWFNYIYISGLILFGSKLIIDILELIILISHNKAHSSNIIRFHGLDTAGFSAFGYIFVNSRVTSEEAGEIIKHEQNHLNHNHSLDIILIELIKVFQWFNPVIHLYISSLRAVHEYQADDECISHGIPVNYYQMLLMKQVFKSRIFPITNSFSNPSLIKKRMIMMTKKRSRALAKLKLFLVLPVIAALMIFISSCSQNNKSVQNETEVAPPPPPPPPPPVGDIDSDTLFEEVDIMPVFKGGDEALMKYIFENIKYPETAKVNGIQGKVIVSFVIEADGSVGKAKVLKAVDPELDKEALRVVSTLPDFEKPGIKDGKAVAVRYMVPINFTLK